jgi:insulysin
MSGMLQSRSRSHLHQRFYQLEKHLSKAGHPYRKFGTGDYDTLWSKPKADGRDPRQQLISWWEKEYCAKRMKLTVIGKDGVDKLEQWVRERFEAVPVRTDGAPAVGPNGQRVVFEDSPTDPNRAGVSDAEWLCALSFGPLITQWVTFGKPVRDDRGIEITFPVPDIEHLYQSKVSSLLINSTGVPRC